MKHLLGVAALLLLPSAAFAQGDTGPFGGLFGRTPEGIGRDYTVFELRTSSSVQFDDALLSEAQLGGLVDRGGTAGVTGAMTFERKSDNLEFRARSTGMYQQLMQAPGLGYTTVDSGVALTSRLGSRLTVDGSLLHFYSPFFNFHPVLFMARGPGGITVPTSTSAASIIENHTFDGRIGVSSQYAKHSTLSGSVTRRETRFRQRREHNQTLNGFGGEWRRKVTRGLGVRLGYNRDEIYEHGRPELRFIHELIDVGVDYLKPLSLSRRTTLTFNTQTAMLRRQDTGRHYRLNGQASLSSAFRRTWQFTLSGQRTTQFLPGFADPLFADTASVGMSGLLSSRAQLVLKATGGIGEFGFDADPGRFRTVHATSQFNYAFTRKFGLFAQYALYFYELPGGASGFSLLNELSRQSVAVGITAWIPIVTPKEAPRDTR